MSAEKFFGTLVVEAIIAIVGLVIIVTTSSPLIQLIGVILILSPILLGQVVHLAQKAE